MAYGRCGVYYFQSCRTEEQVDFTLGTTQGAGLGKGLYYIINGECYRRLYNDPKVGEGEYSEPTITGPFLTCGCIEQTAKWAYIELYECSTQSEVRIQMSKQQYLQLEPDKYYRIDGNCYQMLDGKTLFVDGEVPEHVIEGPYDDCECVAPEPEPTPVEPIIKKRVGNIEYYEKINCEFADAVYNKAMADRYGVEFCCEKDLQRLTIKKKLLDAGALQDDIDLCLL